MGKVVGIQGQNIVVKGGISMGGRKIDIGGPIEVDGEIVANGVTIADGHVTIHDDENE